MKKVTKHHIILAIIIIICCLIGVGAGLIYKQSKSTDGISVTITNYTVTYPKPINPAVSKDTTVKAHIIAVLVENNTSNTFNLLPSVFFQLVSDGKAYELSPDMSVKNPLQGGEIAVDATTSGEISFHVPSNEQGELQFRTSVNSAWVSISK